MKDEERYHIFNKLIDSIDIGTGYITEYDAQLHDYNGTILYQAEAKVIKEVGNQPGITISELAAQKDKTTSAYSQLIRKMKAKGWIEQKRNDQNNREYKLFLSEEGEKIFHGHQKFEEFCYRRTFSMLDEFSVEDLNIFIRIQEKLNESFRCDVEDSSKILKNLKKKD